MFKRIRIVLIVLFFCGIFIVLGRAWYFHVFQFRQDYTYLFGPEIQSYTKVIHKSEPLIFDRVVDTEPQGCTIYVYRFLSPVNNLSVQLHIGSTQRKSLPPGTPIHYVIDIPESIPPGKYLYVGSGSYYCGWVNYIFGPHITHTQPIYIEILPD